jgi:hypothetical protein
MKVLRFSEFINEASAPVKKPKTKVEKNLAEVQKEEKERYAKLDAEARAEQKRIMEEGDKKSRPFKGEFSQKAPKSSILQVKDTTTSQNKKQAIIDSENIKKIEREEALRIKKLFQHQLEEQQDMIARGDKDSFKSYFPKLKRAEYRRHSSSPSSSSTVTPSFYGDKPENPFSVHDFNLLIRNDRLKRDEANPDFYWRYKSGKRKGFKIIK